MSKKNDSRSHLADLATNMRECFRDYPLNQHLFKDVKDADVFMQESCLMNIRLAAKRYEIYTINGDPRALLVMRQGTAGRFFSLIQSIRQYLIAFRVLKFSDIRKLAVNYRTVSRIFDLKWHKKLARPGFLHLISIAIAPELRGSGAFRKLVGPALARADDQNLDVVLETHNPKLLELYGHFGFKLVKTVEIEGVELKQYCLLRLPASNTA